MNTLEWLSHLISFDTTSRNSNLALIEFVKDHLSKFNISSRLSFDATKQKANLFATLPGQNGNIQEGLIFSGHTDVVPVDGQAWDTNPFVMEQVKDRIYGRGTSDMKGFIAVALSLIPEIQSLKLAKPIYFALSYDEETGCHGARVMISEFQEMGIKPKACIVGEPSNMRPVIAHKGIQVYQCKVHGQAAHSSLTPVGCNAIDYAAELIRYIREFANELKQSGPFDEAFDVPFTTISTNLIQGGTANNIIPELCEFYFEFRNLPQVIPDKIIKQIQTYVETVLFPKMERESDNAGIEFEKLGSVPSFESPQDTNIYQLARQISGEQDIVKVAYATEAGLFQSAGIPTIICGPGSIEQAHRPNEFVSIEQLDKCKNFLLKIAEGFCKAT